MISLVTGPMGSGKSAKLIGLIESFRERGIQVVCYKPEVDTRSEYIESRNGEKIAAHHVKSFIEILYLTKNMFNEGQYVVIAIDEIQFISTVGLLDFIRYVREKDLMVVASGLNLTSELKPFEATANFAMYAEHIFVTKGVCTYCNGESLFTKCKVEKSSEILVGDDIYTQTCYNCHGK